MAVQWRTLTNMVSRGCTDPPSYKPSWIGCRPPLHPLAPSMRQSTPWDVVVVARNAAPTVARTTTYLIAKLQAIDGVASVKDGM